MAEPSRPPPPKAYVPSKKPGLPPSRPSAGPSGGGQTDLPIPPRPPPEDIPPVSPTDATTAKSRGGRGSAPPPPPAPYSKRPSAAKLVTLDEGGGEGNIDETDKGQAPPKMRPPPNRPSKVPASRPSKPPASTSKKMEITVVSAQPMTSDVIPSPTLTPTTSTTDPPMPTEPPPEPPTKLKTPPPKPNRSPPIPKATLDGGTEPPLPKRGPAPPKPVRASPPIPRSAKSSQDQESGSSPTSYGSRGSLRKAPPPPVGRTRPPPPQSKPPPPKPKEAESATQDEIGSEYTALITSSVNGREVQENEYIVPNPQAPVPVAEYTEPISSKTVSKSSLPPPISPVDYTEPVSSKTDTAPGPVHKPAPPPPVSRPSAPPPMSRPRPPPTSRPPPPPTQSKTEEPEKRDLDSPTHVYAEVSPSTSQTSVGERDEDTPPPVPNSPRPSAQPKLSETNTSPKHVKRSPPSKPPNSRPRPPPPRVEAGKDDVTGDKATPTARPRPPPPRATLGADKPERGDKSPPTSRPRPPPPKVTSQSSEKTEDDSKTPPTSRPRPLAPKTTPSALEKNDGDDKTTPTSQPRVPPPRTKSEENTSEKDKTVPPPKPHPPKPVPRQDSSGDVKAPPPMKPRPRPKKILSTGNVEEDKTTPTDGDESTTPPVDTDLTALTESKQEDAPSVTAKPRPPPPKKPPVAPKRSIDKPPVTDEDDKPHPPPTPDTVKQDVKEATPPPAKPRPPPPSKAKSLSEEEPAPIKEATPPPAKPRPPLPSKAKSLSEEEPAPIKEATPPPAKPRPPPSKEVPAVPPQAKPRPPPPKTSVTETPSNAPPTRPTTSPMKAPPPSRPGQGPKPKPARPGAPVKSTPPVPVARKGPKEDSGPPPLPPRPEPGHPLYRYVCTNPHGIAKTNKEAAEDDELSYYEGDVIELIEKVDDHWYYGCNADNDMIEGLILAKEMKIVKRLPGQDKVMEDGPCAVAMNTFEGRSSDELSFIEGTLIMLISRVGGDEWLRGRTLKGEEGIFPKAFVEIVEDLPPDAIEQAPSSSSPEYDIPSGPYCIAIETFTGETPEDLSFETGDLIEITERIDESWLRGTTHGRNGMFPQVFVDVKVDAPVGVVGGGGGGEGEGEGGDDENVVVALFDYEGVEGDLSFKEGDKIKLLSKVSEEWVCGELDGREGMFPTSFIDHVPDDLPMKAEEQKEEETKVVEATPPPSESVPPTGECEALFDYESDNLGDLTFAAGEKIVITEWVGDEWLTGRIGEERNGMFPLSFVKITKELPKDSTSKAAAPKSQKKVESEELSDLMPKARAIRNFEPASSLEMRVQTGDMIILLSHEGKGMYMGENTNTGEFGNFPESCVEVIVPLP